ncbi:MAG: hypothetical protein E7365_02740 [Clostridiales bacterium]|nr:hypothetical protein [Clostridiales bacterium]
MIFDTRDNVSWWLQVLAVALSIAIIITGGLMIGWHSVFGSITEGDGYNRTQGQDIHHAGNIVDHTMNPYETHEPDITSHPDSTNAPTIKPSSLSNLKNNIKNWMNNGSPVRDSDVTNILLIGMENNDGNGNPQALSVNGRADAMCIVSINKRTKTVTLASLMRDQYSYIVTGNSGRYTKFHHALSYSGPAKQIEMIERYYKVVIDNYVILNFASLPKAINALGGVKINVTKDEATYLRSIGWNISKNGGPLKVDGYHALTYMRIRKGTAGGDTARVGRQQQVIMSLVNNIKDYSASQIVAAAREVIPYLRTGLTSENILAYAVTAVTEGWFNYTFKQVTLPDDGCAIGFTNPEDGGWYWKVDYPLAAQKLQNALYGKSNIALEPNRKKWI